MSDDRQALQDVMLHYAAAVDERDRERYSELFTDDVEVSGFGDEPILGRDAWLDYVFTALETYRSTQHLLGPMLVEFDGELARTRSDVQATHFLEAEDQAPIILWATYRSTLRRSGGRWRICRHELVPRGIRHS